MLRYLLYKLREGEEEKGTVKEPTSPPPFQVIRNKHEWNEFDERNIQRKSRTLGMRLISSAV